MTNLDNLKIQVFADGADLGGMVELSHNPLIRGFTTNPTLMRKAGVTDYEAFARDVLKAIPERPISFEVFADEIGEMEEQARLIATWGANVYVKIPVTNTRGEFCGGLLRRLAADGVQVNVTAMTTLDQVLAVAESLADSPSAYLSVFAGRVADTGRDPVPMMAQAVELLRRFPHLQLLWASPRELLNLLQADAIGCHVITMTRDLLAKLNLVGKDLDEYSLETVRMFHADACTAGYQLKVPARATAASA